MTRPLQLYYFPTPNGRKVSIALEEMGLAYEIVPVDITADEQRRSDFLEISPNNRIPALIDWTPGGERVRVFESGAILQYLGRRSGQFYPAAEPERAWVDSWLFWQMSGLGPMAGQLSWFNRVANIPDRDPRDWSYARHRYWKEVRRLYGVLDRQLHGREFLCEAYSIADIASWTWVEQYRDQIGGLGDFPAVADWHARIGQRPAVQRGLAVWMPVCESSWSAEGDATQIATGAINARSSAE